LNTIPFSHHYLLSCSTLEMNASNLGFTSVLFSSFIVSITSDIFLAVNPVPLQIEPCHTE
jgi:hypothetical protein